MGLGVSEEQLVRFTQAYLHLLGVAADTGPCDGETAFVRVRTVCA